MAGSLPCGAALACGATAPPFYVVERQAPTGEVTPLNTPLVVGLREDATQPPVESFNPSLTLTDARSKVSLELKSLGGLPTLAWVPVTPLDPETTYEAHFNPGYEGVPDTTWAFTTGTDSTPTLSLEGKLAVTFEPGTDTISECASGANFGCGACTSRGVVKVTKARVKIPHASGGFPRRIGTLWLTDDLPYDFSPASKTGPQPYQGHNVSVAQYADLDDPAVSDVLITVPDEEVAYKPCFAFAASDARGDQATIEPLCLEQPRLPTSEAGSAGNGSDTGASGGPVTDPHGGSADGLQMPSSRTSEGCSFGAEPANGSAWLATLGLLALRRRRAWPPASLSAARRP